jgi:RimJ/RimL family protein N-acetyltransferase
MPDGTHVGLRPLEPEDGHLLRDIFDRLSPASRERRFLTPKERLSSADLRQLTAVDHVDHEAVVGFSPRSGRPVGVARFVRDPRDPETADVAIAVVDAWQSRGLGTILATSLISRARELGVRRFTLLMAQDNEAAVRLMHRVLGDVETSNLDTETAEFVVSLSRGRREAHHVLKGARP